MSKDDKVFIQVPMRHEVEVKKLIMRLTRKPKPIDRKTSYSQHDLVVATHSAKVLKKTFQKLCREYNRFEDLCDKVLTPADQQWASARMSELDRVLGKICGIED